MKILDAKVNPDGNTEVLVQYVQSVPVIQKAVIPSRQAAISIGGPNTAQITTMNEDQYLAFAIQQLSNQLENPPAPDAATASRTSALIGTTITPAGK